MIVLTKKTDAFYLEKRSIPREYNPTDAFDFLSWETEFAKARKIYEHLHENLLYTDEKQHFEEAFHVFDQINIILTSIGE